MHGPHRKLASPPRPDLRSIEEVLKNSGAAIMIAALRKFLRTKKE